MKNKKTAVLFLLAAVALFVSLAAEAAQAPVAAGGQAVVSEGKTVQVDYTLTVDGKVFDSSKGKQPLAVKIGGHQVIPGFEKNLMGMKVGEKKSFTLTPEEGYGPVNPKAFVEVEKSKMPKNVKLAPGMMLVSQAPNGQVFQVKVVKIKKDTVLLDLNNPLAGKTLTFDVQVVDIK